LCLNCPETYPEFISHLLGLGKLCLNIIVVRKYPNCTASHIVIIQTALFQLDRIVYTIRHERISQNL